MSFMEEVDNSPPLKGQLLMDAEKTYINPDTDDQMEITGWQKSLKRDIITWIAIIFTVGILRLVFHWKPEWMLRATHVRCDLRDAQKALLKDKFLQQTVVKIITLSTSNDENSDKAEKTSKRQYTEPITSDQRAWEQRSFLHQHGGETLRYFEMNKIRFFWKEVEQTFEALSAFPPGTRCAQFYECTGLTEDERIRRRLFFGDNTIVVHVTPILRILFTEILNPFYVFQIYSVTLWYLDEYHYYATAIVIISIVSLTVSVYQTRKMQRRLKSTISGTETITRYDGNGQSQEVFSDVLVPGDVIVLPRNGGVMQCDAVLLTGNVIVNESMLTGEAVPVTKTPLPQADGPIFDMKEHSRHVIFCGTQVIQTRYYGAQDVQAVVLRTGFATSKGELVRSIMYPKPLNFKFTRDAFKFIGLLAILALGGMVFTIVIMIYRKVRATTIVLRTLDLITIVIPPALPAVMSIGTVYAQTGTLTEDGLDLWGVLPTCKNHKFLPPVSKATELQKGPVVVAMATCHSLTLIEGQLSGDPLDVKMFQSVGWELEEPGEDNKKFDVFMPTVVRPSFASADEPRVEVGIVRQFPFSSRLQRMSVVARTLGGATFDLYAKGSPEAIALLCNADSVPENYHNELQYYTQQGYRVIALAWRQLALNYVKVQRASRESLEIELNFLGLLVMENRLKIETAPVIGQLQKAKIRTIMVTGDNMLTALSVARECQMVQPGEPVVLCHVTSSVPPHVEWTATEDVSQSDKRHSWNEKNQGNQPDAIIPESNVHIAITGRSWRLLNQHFPDLVQRVAVKGTVFARMSPDQKSQVISTLQDAGYYVGMCGDGANDCGALKTAHAGIALSDTEASVASPFTSKDPNISCVPTLIREGRAALTTSFGVFKYMMGYSLTQFTSVTMLYYIAANLTDFQFLYIDLFLLTTLGITFGYTAAYHDLVPEVPAFSLVSLKPILAILLQMVVIIFVQFFTWAFTAQQPWFEAFVPNDDEDYTSYEVTCIFLVSSYQYIMLAFVFSKSAPYRKPVYTNYLFMANLVICVGATLWVNLGPLPWMISQMEMRMPPSLPFRGILVGIAAANFLVGFILETFIMDSRAMSRLDRKLNREEKRRPYNQLQVILNNSPNWPPVSKSNAGITDILRAEMEGQGQKNSVVDAESSDLPSQVSPSYVTSVGDVTLHPGNNPVFSTML